MKFNRREFVMNSAIGIAVAAITPESWIRKAIGLPPKQPKRFGAFDVGQDGTLSLGGQTEFAVYGTDGGLSLDVVTYRWERDAIIESRLRPHGHKTERTVWTVANGGTF